MSRVAGAVGEVELDQLAGADIVDAGKAEPFERMVDRLALRVEHTGLKVMNTRAFMVSACLKGVCGDPMASRQIGASFTRCLR